MPILILARSPRLEKDIPRRKSARDLTIKVCRATCFEGFCPDRLTLIYPSGCQASDSEQPEMTKPVSDTMQAENKQTTFRLSVYSGCEILTCGCLWFILSTINVSRRTEKLRFTHSSTGMDIKHWLLLTVLVDEHTDRDAAQVEAVQKVLDILVGYQVLGESLFVFYDTLGHGRHDIVVPVSDGD